VADYRFSYESFDCPLCRKIVAPPHVKRHLAAHDRRTTLGHLTPDEAAQLKETSDIAWVRWLEARDEIAAENADRMVEIIEGRRSRA
jgi:hypothetical protein